MQRLVNRVSVEASFFKKMSAAENLAYAARFYGMGPRETHAKIPVILERVGFPSARRNEAMENLSRGMQQKVALARALLTSPVLLLLDEPTTGLDPRSKQEVQNFIREIRLAHDATILLCTHDMNEAEELADRIGLLDRGELLFLEPVDEVKRALRRRDARGGVLRRDRPHVRGRARRRGRGERGVRMTTPELTFTRRRVLRGELIGLYGVVERNLYLTRRYLLWDLAFLLWTIANTLTIVFISRGVDLSPAAQNELETQLLVGGVIWAFLGIIFEIVTETVAWERWEGTIEYTFMAPVVAARAPDRHGCVRGALRHVARRG